MKIKLEELLREYAYACILNGARVQTITPDSHWFARWQEDYGLSLRKANRKFAVPREVLKVRLELFWVSLFRLRKLAKLCLGYEPDMWNFDRSPYHHNESGSQNKATLGVRGSTIPVVEGTDDVRTRWTAQLTTCSSATAIAAGHIPPAECMFKGTREGTIHKRLAEHRRQRCFPKWLTVGISEKGSYREHDVITWLREHLEEWTEGRDWRFIFADDFRAHKTENVFHFCWSRGYVLIVHVVGATPVAQTPDTDLNEDVRRRYGHKEAGLLLEKMRHGCCVPSLSQEECMDLMLEILSDKELHERAAYGYKKVGQSVDLYGAEDNLIVREAGKFWNMETSEGLANMRAKVNAEMEEVEIMYDAKDITWDKESVRRLINKYPEHKRTDKILANLGDDYGHNAIHHLSDVEEDDGESAEDAASDGDGEPAVGEDSDNEFAAGSEDDTAVAADREGPSTNEVATDAMEGAIVRLDATQAETLAQHKVQISALQSAQDRRQQELF